MEIIGNVSDKSADVDPEYGPITEYGTEYSVLRYPGCLKINIVSYDWDEGIESEDEISYNFLYPQNPSYPIGLPEKILTAFKAAEKVKFTEVLILLTT